MACAAIVARPRGKRRGLMNHEARPSLALGQAYSAALPDLTDRAAMSPCVTDRCRMVGLRPGESALGVTSLDGNICTKAGARFTRSTTVRSRTIEVYWSAPRSGVFE